MPTSDRQRVKKQWNLVIVLSIIFFVVIVAQDILRESFLVNGEITEFTIALENDFKESIQKKTEQSVFDIEKIIEERDTNFSHHLQLEVGVIHSSLSQTINLLDGEANLEEELINAVVDFGNIDLKHEYFLLKTDGTLLYDGILKQEVSTIVLSEKDMLNRDYFNQLITQSESNDYVEINTAFMIEEEYTEYKYLGYKLEDSEYIILVRGSLNKYTEHTIVDYFNGFVDRYNDEDDTLIIFDSEGQIYFHRNRDFIEDNISALTKLSSYFTELETILEYSNKGFINEQRSDTYKIADIGYFEYNNDTDLIVLVIGESASANRLIDGVIDHNITSMLIFLVPFYVVLAGIALLIIRTIIKNIRLSKRVSTEEEILSTTLANTTEDFIIITDKKGYILYMNDIAEETLFNKETEGRVNLDELMVEEDGFKVLIGINDNVYIKYNVIPIVYHSQESELYFIKDVTKEVKKEKALEKLTLIDDLTGLGNRRQMVKDYNDFVLPEIKNGNKAFLAMMDLDNFKQANDLYGHAYGDEVLENIASVFKEVITDHLKIYRVGGDEFALLAVNTTQNTLLSILRKLRNKITNFKYKENVDVSFSGGLVQVDIKSSKRRLSDYYDKADELLYIAKKEAKGTTKI